MKWQDVRRDHPDVWLVIEAAEAHSESNARVVDDICVIEAFSTADAAMKLYLELHHASPDRELYVAHTSRSSLDIQERRWAGIRRYAQ